MKSRLYTTFMAQHMTVEELLRFLKDFSDLECTSWTITCITWSETSPRTCTIALHVEADQDQLLRASFETGRLMREGWNKQFIVCPMLTPGELLDADHFAEPPMPATPAVPTVMIPTIWLAPNTSRDAELCPKCKQPLSPDGAGFKCSTCGYIPEPC